MTARLVRPLERAVCDVVGVPRDALWSRSKRQDVRLALGLFVYVVTKTTPLSAADVADLAGRNERAIEDARSLVARRAFHCPAVRRALHDIAAARGIAPSSLIPSKVEHVPA